MAGLSEFIQRLERLATSQVEQRVASKVRDVAHKECLRGFVEQRDPYGVPWAPRKDKRGTWPILDKTGKGVESLTSTVAGGTVRLRMKSYMRFHQTGTTHATRSNVKTKREIAGYSMPARKVFPDPDRGLGTWSQPINDAAREAVRELVESTK